LWNIFAPCLELCAVTCHKQLLESSATVKQEPLVLAYAVSQMNLSLYSVNAFLILDADGHRVLAKYYRPKGHPQGESKALLTLKEQRAFEKGLWQKTKKAGGAYYFSYL
jgi:hypothetical protein